MDVRFTLDHRRTIAALTFLAAKKLPDLTKWRICKLLFLADRLHLTRYARPITGGTYYAMEWGPVPSDTLSALNDENPLSISIEENIERIPDHYPKYALRAGRKVLRDFLSDSDVEVLNEIVTNYGSLPFSKLNDIVHGDRAYLLAWKQRIGNRALMKFEDFFETKNEVFEEVLENSSLQDAFA